MKKTVYILLSVLAGFILSGCDKMLDVYPKDRMSPETFFKSEKELQAFGMNFYEMLPGGASLYIEDADDFRASYHKGLFVDIFPMIDYPDMPMSW